MNMNGDNANNVDVLEEFVEITCLDSSLHSQPEYRVDIATNSEVERDVFQVSLPTLPTPLSHDDCAVELQSYIERRCCSRECVTKFPPDIIRESRLARIANWFLL